MPAGKPTPPADLAVVTRGDQLESIHRGHAVVVRAGQVVASFGDVHAPVWTRSAIKPFQALPLFDRGLVARLDLSDQELALISASHQGTALHVATVDGLLRKGGLQRGDLGCGPHAPFDREASFGLVRADAKPERIHNNCSGKHTGFLLLAKDCGTPLSAYLDPESTAQQLVRQAVADMTDVPVAELGVAVDGCGAPTLRLPLVALARGFWRLSNPESPAAALPPGRRQACARLLAAVNHAPVHLAGHGRLCTALIESAPGRLYPKNGAEGVYAVGVAGLDLGIAIKVDDGAERGYTPVVIELLRRMGVWRSVPASLAEFARVPIRNTRKEVVGFVEAAL